MTTVRTIRANKDTVRAAGQYNTPLGASRSVRTRGLATENMEHLLSAWIEDQNQRHVPISLLVVQVEARSIFNDLKGEQGESRQSETFNASRDWFEQFKRHSNLHNIKMTRKTTKCKAIVTG